MKRQMLLSIVASFVLLGNVSAGEKLNKILIARETELLDAIKQNDHQKLKKLLASQAFAVVAQGRKTTPQLLKILAKTNLTSYSIKEAKTVPVSKDVAILTFKFVWSGMENGKRFNNATSYATVVWALREGRWVSVFYHESPARK